MNEKQIQAIEKKFSITLPHGYRSMLLAPPELFATVTKQDHKSNPGQTPFFMDHRIITGVNQWVRNPDDEEYFEFDPNDDSKPWPDRYFIIGSDVGGNFYCVAPQSKRSRVYFWYQGDTTFAKFADDMAGFVKRVFKSYGEIAAMDCADDSEA